MSKVLQKEGRFPSGAIQTQWPIVSYSKEGFAHITEWWERGERWRAYRSLMQQAWPGLSWSIHLTLSLLP